MQAPSADTELLVIGVSSAYAWEVVESAHRLGLAVRCVDNHGGADPALPGLTTLDADTDRGIPFTIGLSSATARPAALTALVAAGFIRAVGLVDPTAVVASTVELGHAAYVNAGVVVGSHTRIGCAVNVNRSASIGHDNRIGHGASVGPGVVTGGHVVIGARTLLGVGAVVRPGVAIGEGCTVGAGAVVVADVAPGAVVVGNPARVLRTEAVPEETSCPLC